MDKNIGVSYSSSDKCLVDELDNNLFNLGIKLIRYDTHLIIQDDIRSFMENMSKLDKTLIFLSEKYLNSQYCIAELGYLLPTPEKIVFIYVDNEVDVSVLLENARKHWELNCNSIDSWLEIDYAKICVILDELANALERKYLTSNEMLNQNGIKQLLGILKYTPATYIDELEKILSLDNFYEREVAFANYLKAAPPNDVFNHYKAISYEMQGYIEGAAFFLHQAIQINPTYVAPYIKLINLAFQYPDEVVMEASIVDMLESISDADDKDKSLICKAKGLIYYQKSKQERNSEHHNKLIHKSIEQYKESASLSKGLDAVVYNNLGLMYEEIGEIESALQAYMNAIEIEPNYYQALNNLGLVFDKYLGNAKMAQNVYKECLKIEPHYIPAQSNYALLMEKIDYNTSLKLYLDLLCSPHTQTDYITNLALILEEEKISEYIAGLLYRIVLEMKPKSIPANFNMGNYLRRQEAEYEEIMRYFGLVIEAVPDNDLLLISMALLYVRENDFDKALYYCNRALNKNPGYISAVYIKSIIHAQIDLDIPQTIDYVELFVRKNENNEEANCKLPKLYYALYILHSKLNNPEGTYWRDKAIKADSRFNKSLSMDECYKIIEYEYPTEANERIYKHRRVNIAIDDMEMILSHIKKLYGINNEKA